MADPEVRQRYRELVDKCIASELTVLERFELERIEARLDAEDRNPQSEARDRQWEMERALIGLVIGAAGGLATGATIDHGDHGWFPNLGKAVLTPIGAIIGTVVGGAIPAGGWRVVYRAP